jgi:SAM-dependent methyltransferase
VSDRFAEIYENNEWGYGSGVGSLALNNIEYMKFLHTFLRSNGIESVVDLGCGDWQFSQFIDWGEATYLGLDVAETVIQHNRARFSRPNVGFATFNSDDDVPYCDLALCKDVFQHLPNATIAHNLKLLKSRARFLLITNDAWPCAELTNNDVEPGGWRPVSLAREPFGEIAPVVLAWTVEWVLGGWNPTGKTTCLILGDRA